MSVEEALIYLALFLLSWIIGMPLGAWLNSKLLTKTWKSEAKSELDKVRKEISESEEYGMTIELLRNLNELLKSEEARNFFANATKALKQLTGPSQDGESVFSMPEKVKQKEDNV